MFTSIGRFFLVSLIVCSFTATAQPVVSNIPKYVAHQVIVSFQPGTPASAIAEAHRQAGAAPMRNLGAIDAVVVNTGSRSVPAAVAAYQRNPNVRYAEPNYLRLMVIPDEGVDPNPLPRPLDRQLPGDLMQATLRRGIARNSDLASRDASEDRPDVDDHPGPTGLDHRPRG